MYSRKLEQYKDRQYEINTRLEEHTRADENYHITAGTVLNLARHARELFDRSEIPEKRALLNYLLQNGSVSGKKLAFTVRKPFDVVLELANCPTVLPG